MMIQAPQQTAKPQRLAEGVELLGRYEGSGFKDPPYLVRRVDGQVLQLPRLLYLVAEEIDGSRGLDEIAAAVAARFERPVSADNIGFLIDEKLRPLGLIAGGGEPPAPRADPMLGLKLRTAVVPAGVVRVLAALFSPLFRPIIVALALASLAVVDAWLFFFEGVAQGVRAILYDPLWMLVVLGLVVGATALHEFGHAAAARYGGARPGAMGVGIYIVWPAFYTDVTDAYRLGRGGRLRTDLGGVYFNGLAIVAAGAAYAVTGFRPLVAFVLIQHLQALQQFIPFVRLDGYYVLRDLTGVPDLFARLKPTLRSLLPWRRRDPRVEELKPWARWTIAAWVVAVLPVLVLVFGALVLNAPRILATGWDSLRVLSGQATDAFRGGDHLAGALDSLRAVFLVLPIVGATVTVTKTGGRIASGAWGWAADSVPRRAGVLAVGAAAALSTGYVWVPNGEYEPIQRGERGTVQGAVRQFTEVTSGRPALTERRVSELRGVVRERDRRRARVEEEQERGKTAPTGGDTTQRAAPATPTTDTTDTAFTDWAFTEPYPPYPPEPTPADPTVDPTTNTTPVDPTTDPATTDPAATEPAPKKPMTTDTTSTDPTTTATTEETTP